MPTYYVGPGGNDGNSGLTWALRKLTLNGAEDVPVVAGDIVYVGPGVYRETLTCDVSGGAGNIITYIGDVTGEHTDGVGGIVRITGSDNDQTTARNYAVTMSTKHYRTFRGFFVDTCATQGINNSDGNYVIIEDCVFAHNLGYGARYMGDATNGIIRRCMFIGNGGGIVFYAGVAKDNRNQLVENCGFYGHKGTGIEDDAIGGVAVRNSTFVGNWRHVTSANLNAGQTVTANNSILTCAINDALRADVLGRLVENLNDLWCNTTDRTNVAVGANSVAYSPLFLPPILYAGAGQVSGFKFPWWFAELSEWSQIQAITGANEPAVDLLGMARPATASKNSWGAVQFHDSERDTATVHSGTASLTLNDAGRVQFTVPVTATNTNIRVYCRREANYAGTNPQMVIKQPGQADRTTTDTGGTGAWNLLADAFVPGGSPPYVIVELVSNNTAVAGNYAAYFDDLNVYV